MPCFKIIRGCVNIVTMANVNSQNVLTHLARVLFWLVAAGLALYAALTLWLAFRGVFFSYQLDYGEGIVLWFIRQLAHGQSIYNPLGEPYVSSNYPPVFMLIAAPFDVWFGTSYIWGRTLNFAAIVIVSALIARLVRGETASPRASWLAGLFFFGSTFVYHWTPLLRVDMPGMVFTMAGVVCVWAWERRTLADGQSHLWLPVLAGMFFLLALYTKHSLLFAPAAATVAIFLRNKRAAIVFALALGIVGGAIFVWMEMVTRGGWSFGLIASNATVWTTRVFVPLLSSFFVTYSVLLGLGAWSWVQRVWRRRKIGVLEIYAVAALFSIALAGREGAWENYFFEAIAMTCVFAGFTIAQWQSASRWNWVLPALLLVQLALFWDQHDPRIAENLFAETRAGNENIARLIQQANGTVISEDMGLLVTNGKPVAYYTFPYSTLARAGKWDQHWEIENLRAGNFPRVILMQGTRTDVDHFGNFTRAFVSALDYAYDVAAQNARYQVYAPAPLQNLAPNAKFGGLFELAGWSLEPQTLRAGQDLNVTLVWRALQKPNARFTHFVHLEDANGGIVAQDDHEPKSATYPTTRWAQNEMVRDTFRLKIPLTLKPGEYFLRAGWYDALSQDRLSLPDGADVVELKEITAP